MTQCDPILFSASRCGAEKGALGLDVTAVTVAWLTWRKGRKPRAFFCLFLFNIVSKYRDINLIVLYIASYDPLIRNKWLCLCLLQWYFWRASWLSRNGYDYLSLRFATMQPRPTIGAEGKLLERMPFNFIRNSASRTFTETFRLFEILLFIFPACSISIVLEATSVW